MLFKYYLFYVENWIFISVIQCYLDFINYKCYLVDFFILKVFVFVFACYKIKISDKMPRLFVCNLGENYRPSDVTELFDDYGTIKNLNLKGKYGFVDLEYDSDCKEAMRDLNGRSFNGGRLIVQWAKKEHNNNESSHDNKDDRRSESSRSYRYNDSPPLASSDRYKNQPQRKRCSDGRFRISNWRVIVSGTLVFTFFSHILLLNTFSSRATLLLSFTFL